MFEKTTTLKVSGMMCADCEKRVQDAVLALEGVKGCKASAKQGAVKVKGADDALLLRIKQAITDAGYTVE